MSNVHVNESILFDNISHSTLLLSPSALFSQSDFEEFCPTELFEIVFANELTPDCTLLRNGIVEANKKEIFTNVVFITPDDILKFTDAIEKDNLQNFWHPPQYIENLKTLCKNYIQLPDENDETRNELYARILKHYIINKMCVPSFQENERCKKISKLNESLKKLQTSNILSSTMKQIKPKGKKATKKKVLVEQDDLMPFVPSKLSNDSDELRDHIYFYILTGFKDSALLKILRCHNVPIHCLLHISTKEYVSRAELDPFWRELDEMSKRFKTYKLTEDMIHMKYVYKSQIPDEDQGEFFKQRLTEFYNILMEIPQLKRKHIQYIKHLFPFEFNQREFRHGPFPFYESNMQNVPTEFVTIPYILKSIIDEVENNISIERKKCRQDEFDLVCKMKCDRYRQIEKPENAEIKFKKEICPLRISDFKKPHVKHSSTTNEDRTMLKKFHEGDYLNILMTMNKHLKNMVLSDVKMLSNQKLLQVRKMCEASLFCSHEDDICILREEFTPKMKKPLFTKDQTDHFLNLLFLSNMKISDGQLRKKQAHSKYLFTGAEIFEDLNFLPDSNVMMLYDNLYQKFNGMQYRWVEALPNTTLIQRLFNSQLEFSTCHFQFCYQTNTFLIYFHHNLTSSGTRSTTWRDSLRTLTCLRDFCSFYMFEDAEWIEKHNPMEQIKFEEYKKNENDRYFQRMIESDNRYYEYKKYLAPFRYCGDASCQGKSTCTVEECQKTDRQVPMYSQLPNLREIMSEIKTYPTGYELRAHCAKETRRDNLLSYDKRSQRFGLTGSTHEFFSHDGVKVTIDTCRFHFEDFKLGFAVKFDKNVLFGHFGNDKVNIHIVLANDTVILFRNLHDLSKTNRCSNSEVEFKETVCPFSISTGAFSNPNLHWNGLVNDTNHREIEAEERKMVAIYEDNDFVALENTSRRIPERESKRTYTKILKRLIPKNESYKVTYHKTKHLIARCKKQNVLYSSIVTRILKGSIEEKEKPVYHRYIHEKRSTPSKNQKDFSVKITLPNGLMIESIPTTTNGREIAIKQTHSVNDKHGTVKDEDYRLFFSNGIILIRRKNGNVRIMDTHGTIVELREKTTRIISDLDRKRCLRNIEMCRKKLYMLKKTSMKKPLKIDLYKRSRLGHLNYSIKLNMRQHNILDNFKLPFSKVDVMSLDGSLYKIREGVVKKNAFSKYLDTHDFMYHERLRERTDSMRFLTKNDGSIICVFPDGTKITKTMVVHNKVEFYSKRDKEGWVIVTTNYLYEHPRYLPTEFKNAPRLTLIHLKDNVTLKLDQEQCNIQFGEKEFLHVNPEHIDLRKTCLKCGSSCICNIDIELMEIKDRNKYEPFLTVKDSYNKEFQSDSQGRCKVNTDFIKGELNNMKCNHYLNNDYQKIFLVHADLSGELLWNDKMVIREIDKIEREIEIDPKVAKLEKLTTVDNSMTSFKFIRNKYVQLKDKFTSPKYMFPMVFLEKSDVEDSPIPVYQETRSIFNMFQEEDIDSLRNIFKKLFKD